MGALIPDKKSDSVSGSEFAKTNLNNKYNIIDKNVLAEGLAGNIPNFLRNFVSVSITEGNNKLTYLVMPDVFSIGSDDDFIRMPMSPLVAKKIADKYNCMLPTKKMCDQIWKAATIKVSPTPKGAPYDNSMLSMDTFVWHNNKIEAQIVGKDRGELITGHKKDIIISPHLINNKDKVCIYGWFYPNGKAIQGPTPNYTTHEISYYDYSHSVRLIAREIIINDVIYDIYDILLDKILSKLISDDGAFDAKNIYK